MGGKPRGPVTIARKLVKDYLRSEGGSYNGFNYERGEEALAQNIAKEIRNAERRGASRATPVIVRKIPSGFIRSQRRKRRRSPFYSRFTQTPAASTKRP